MTRRNRILDLGERQISSRCNEFFQGGSERTTLGERHIQGTSPQVRTRFQCLLSQTVSRLRIERCRTSDDRTGVLSLMPPRKCSLNHQFIRVRILKTRNLKRIQGKHVIQQFRFLAKYLYNEMICYRIRMNTYTPSTIVRAHQGAN